MPNLSSTRKSALQLHAEAALNAVADAGLIMADVDGLLTGVYWNYDVAEFLGSPALHR